MNSQLSDKDGVETGAVSASTASAGAETDSENSAATDAASASTSLTRSVHRSSGSYEMVLSAAILGLVGFGLDSLFGLLPILTVSLTVAGFVGAVVSIYYRYKHAMREYSKPTTTK